MNPIFPPILLLQLRPRLDNRDFLGFINELRNIAMNPTNYGVLGLGPGIWNASDILIYGILHFLTDNDYRNLYAWLPPFLNDQLENINKSFIVECLMKAERWNVVEDLYTQGWRPTERELVMISVTLTENYYNLRNTSNSNPAELLQMKHEAEWFIAKGFLNVQDIPSELLLP